jgi:hypothetical protein
MKSCSVLLNRFVRKPAVISRHRDHDNSEAICELDTPLERFSFLMAVSVTPRLGQ